MDQLNRGFTDNSNFSRYANLSDVEPEIHHSDKKQQEITKRDVGELVAHVETGFSSMTTMPKVQ